MTEMFCTYTGDREATLMAYFYDEITPAERDTFERHLESCARCRVELTALGGVRAQLARWSPPDFQSHALERRSEVGSRQSPRVGRESRVVSRQSWWREMPAWAQVAAAALVIGVSAGFANLNVHYDAQSGLNVRTGWGSAPDANVTGAPVPANTMNTENLASRAELARLEEQLRTEIRSIQNAQAPAAVRVSLSDGDVQRRLRAIVEESERRQQNEVALRVAGLVRDINAQRQSDLRKIDMVQDQTGVEVIRTRQQVQQMNAILQRVSQRQ